MVKAQISLSQREFEFLLSGMGIEKEFSGMINVETLREKIFDYGKKYAIKANEKFDEIPSKRDKRHQNEQGDASQHGQSQIRKDPELDEASDLIVSIQLATQKYGFDNYAQFLKLGNQRG